MPQIQWIDGLYEARGIDRATGQIFQPAVTYTDLKSVVDNEGQKPTLTLRTVSGTTQLSKSLGVEASASLRVSRRGNVSIEANFSQSIDVNSYYLYALVTVEVINAPKTIRNVVLTDDASQLLASNGWTEFAKSYGLEYVEGYITGGYYYAVLEIQTTDSKQKQEIGVQLSGSYNGFGVNTNVTTDATNKIKQALTGQKVNVFVRRSGGTGSLQVTLDQMIQQAIDFPQQVQQSPVPMIALVNTYQGTVKLPKTTSELVFSNIQADTLNRYGELYLKLKDYQSNLNFALAHLNEFEDVDPVKLDAKRLELETALAATSTEMDNLLDASEACSEDSSACTTAKYTLPASFIFLDLPGGSLVDLQKMEQNITSLLSDVQDLKANTVKYNQYIWIQSRANKYLQQWFDPSNNYSPTDQVKWSDNKHDWEALKIFNDGNPNPG